jgi:hypothetical protein
MLVKPRARATSKVSRRLERDRGVVVAILGGAAIAFHVHHPQP